jgi:uncharacterized protein YbcI
MTDEADTTTERALAEEMQRIHKEAYGVTAATARVKILDDAIVVFLDDLELMPHEEFLIDAGKGDAVVEVRRQFQSAIAPTFRAAVERTTGRRVVGFVSATELDPNYAVEVFRLGPANDAIEEAHADE